MSGLLLLRRIIITEFAADELKFKYFLFALILAGVLSGLWDKMEKTTIHLRAALSCLFEFFKPNINRKFITERD